MIPKDHVIYLINELQGIETKLIKVLNVVFTTQLIKVINAH